MDTDKFVKTRVLSELSSRITPGTFIHPIAWILLGWYSSALQSHFANFFYIGLGLLALSSAARLAIIVWIKDSINWENFWIKLKLLQCTFTLTSAIWSGLLIYILITPALESIHIPTILISLCVGISSAISISLNSLLRICIPVIHLLSACVGLIYSTIENNFLLCFLCLLFLLYALALTKLLYNDFWNSLRNEVSSKNHVRKLKMMAGQLQVLSQIDGLTQLYNRMYFDQTYIQEWNKASRQSYPISLLLIDIDHFKRINDSLGHSFGDYCLKEFSTVLKAAMRRSGDIIARYGGEEFIILMPQANVDAAVSSAKRILTDIRNKTLITEQGHTLNITCSIGVATVIPEYAQQPTSEELINEADTALYSAKAAGRNKVAVFERAAQNNSPTDSQNNQELETIIL